MHRLEVERFERILQCHTVYYGGEHSHVVGGRAPEAGFLAGDCAADKISPANNDGDFLAGAHALGDLVREETDLFEVEPEVVFLAETLAADFKQHPGVVTLLSWHV